MFPDKKDGKSSPKIFISYSGSAEMDEYSNFIKESLSSEIKFDLLYEKLNLEHNGEIYDLVSNKDEMKYFIILMNESFFQSQDCLFEFNEILRAKRFRNRCFPILLKDSGVFDDNKRMEYVRYWDDEIKVLMKKAEHDRERENQILFDIKKCSVNRILIDSLFIYLKELNTLREDEETSIELINILLKKSLKTKIEIDSELINSDDDDK